VIERSWGFKSPLAHHMGACGMKAPAGTHLRFVSPSWPKIMVNLRRRASIEQSLLQLTAGTQSYSVTEVSVEVFSETLLFN
jgi:hypothetical protein